MRLMARAGRAPRAALTIAPLHRRDLAEVLRIEQVSYPAPWSAEVFRGELTRVARGDGDYLVVRRGNELIGYGGLMYVLDEAHVTNIVVAAPHRGSGLGTRLLAELAWRAVGRGCTGLTLEVRAGNHAAQALYARFGFERAGIRVRYYENTEDAIVMWCHDIQSVDFAARLRSICPEAAR